MRFTLLLLALCACKQSTRTSGDVASCNLEKSGNCREYGAANLALGSDHIAKICSISPTAVFSMQPCPTANVTGRCAEKEHTDIYYPSYPIPITEVEMACKTSGGTFTKAP